MARGRYTAADDVRCEALVRGHPGWRAPADKDHRCPRRANQMRGCQRTMQAIKVCYQHAHAKTVEGFNGV